MNYDISDKNSIQYLSENKQFKLFKRHLLF